jgi:hypothetical protein
MNKLTLTILLGIIGLKGFAQFPANSYQSAENKNYWKNKKPYDGYWQQDIHYKINASLDDSTNIITASEELIYTNNSPDSLPFVYFHLYSNAQAKGSYLSDLYKNNGKKIKYGKYQEQGFGTNVSKISVNGIELKTEQDNTILKVYLNHAIKPGESLTFNIDFKTYFDDGTLRNRMKLFNAWGYKHYDVVHWYPRISVYDRKQGWDTDQHMEHEFYGNFGTYDVAFTLPNNYIADATGTLINAQEVMPSELRERLDLKNFTTKPWNSPPSAIIQKDGTTKTWMYHAENVHDFALTTDPTYRIDEKEWNGIKCVALVQEPHAIGWKNAASYTAKIIEINSTDFGMYEYPKMIVADAQDGMEYPMLTLDGGFDPSYRDLLVHEVGHNWFFGMIGSNETYRAALDEGFTQFITSWTCQKIDGELRVVTPPKSKYVQRFTEPDYIINSEVYNGYMYSAAKDIETDINKHSDGYNGALGHGGGYSQVYFKTAVMLYNLQYVLGDSLFLNAMQHYVKQWKFAHPYFEDFRNSIIQYTKVDLNWFFDQWIESTNTVDYAVQSVKKGNKTDEYLITFERKGMQMPIDFSITSKDDSSTYNFYIPNNWFEKQTTATTLPRWIGWDKVQPTYTATVIIPGGIKDIIIDPTNRLADVYMLDNSKKLPIQYRFDSKINNSSNWQKYQLYSRPEVWYNGYDGVKLGIHLNGNYLNHKHVLNATIWLNMGLGQSYLDTITSIHGRSQHDMINFSASYSTATDKFMKGSSFYCSAKALDGLNAYTVGFDRKDRSEKNKVYMYFKSMYRKTLYDLHYLLLPDEWQANQLNNTLNLGLEHKYNYRSGNGNINIGTRSSAILSDYDYQNVHLNVVNKTTIWKFLLNTRFFAQYGTGNNWAKESSLFLSGANPEEMMENKYTRSQGFINPDWASYGANLNHFQYGGGLNLRGYSGYLAAQQLNDGTIVNTYKGQSGAAVNAELEFNNLVSIKKRNWLTRTFKLNTYLFGDAGVINYTTPSNASFNLSAIRVDAGVGTALTIKKFGVLQNVKPLTIRFDMPLFLNRMPFTDKNYIQYRFVVGINRAF